MGERRWTRIACALLGAGLVAFGGAMALLGGWLAALGGSLFYLPAGLGLVLTGILVARRSHAAPLVHGLVLVGTIVFALVETGLEPFGFTARLGLIALFGLAVLAASWRGGGAGRTILALALAVSAGAGALAASHSGDAAGAFLPESQTGPPARVAGEGAGWPAYGRTLAGDRYSPLADITPANIGDLALAWTYRTGDLPSPGEEARRHSLEATPLAIGDRLYLCTARSAAIALDADTGREVWRFDPDPDPTGVSRLICRGVSYLDTGRSQDSACRERIYLPTVDGRLFALDARDGRPCRGFGAHGAVDLWAGMADPARDRGRYFVSSPPLVANGLVIVGGRVMDNISTREPSGVIRAYDAVSGALRWAFDAGDPGRTDLPTPGRPYSGNGPNSWGPASADEALGLGYFPLGSATPDLYGPDRSAGSERYGTSILALELATGRPRWVFQAVHHDLWDMDIGGQPSLVDLDMPAGRIPALVASTKTGDIYVLDRRSGEPIVPVSERPVPQGALPPDFTAPTQPISALSLQPPPLTERDMWGVVVLDQIMCRIRFRSLRYDGSFTAPRTDASLLYPGPAGVFNWGGIAVDPIRQIAIASPNHLAFRQQLVPAPEHGPRQRHYPMYGTPYSAQVAPLLSPAPFRFPCQAPPWGLVAGIDLRRGTIAWQRPVGTPRLAADLPMPLSRPVGVPGLGGPMVTAGGVAFLAATTDDMLRGFDVTTGREIWRSRLPAGGQATPMTFRSPRSGRQYVVIAAGGHGSLGTSPGDFVVAYALPETAATPPQAASSARSTSRAR